MDLVRVGPVGGSKNGKYMKEKTLIAKSTRGLNTKQQSQAKPLLPFGEGRGGK